MNYEERIHTIIKEFCDTLEEVAIAPAMIDTLAIITKSLRNGGTVFACGNGGSAEQAAHFVGELVARFKKERKGIRAIALGMNIPVLTAWSNDYDYRTAFRRELEALGKIGDVLVAFSTSGNSKNVIEAVEYAKQAGIQTVGLLGKGGGALAPLVNTVFVVPSRDTARIQEVHLVIIHILSELLEEMMYSSAEV